MRRLLLMFFFVWGVAGVGMSATIIQTDKAQQYLREAQRYNDQAEKYEREAEQLTKKADNYTRQADRYAKKTNSNVI